MLISFSVSFSFFVSCSFNASSRLLRLTVQCGRRNRLASRLSFPVHVRMNCLFDIVSQILPRFRRLLVVAHVDAFFEVSILLELLTDVREFRIIQDSVYLHDKRLPEFDPCVPGNGAHGENRKHFSSSARHGCV